MQSISLSSAINEGDTVLDEKNVTYVNKEHKVGKGVALDSNADGRFWGLCLFTKLEYLRAARMVREQPGG